MSDDPTDAPKPARRTLSIKPKAVPDPTDGATRFTSAIPPKKPISPRSITPVRELTTPEKRGAQLRLMAETLVCDEGVVVGQLSPKELRPYFYATIEPSKDGVDVLKIWPSNAEHPKVFRLETNTTNAALKTLAALMSQLYGDLPSDLQEKHSAIQTQANAGLALIDKIQSQEAARRS